jgi:dihydrofolate reductase
MDPMATQYYSATSLDGFVATADDSVAWLDALGEPTESSYPDFIRDVGAIAMGSATYDWVWRHLFSAASPDDASASSAQATWPYDAPTWVFTTRTLPRVPGADIRFVRGDVRPVHDDMQRVAGDRNIWLVGGGDLVGQFHDTELLDELILQVGSVTLGAGKPVLPRHIVQPPLQLQSARVMSAGFVELRYRVPRASDQR